MKLLLFLIGIVIVIAIAAQNAMNLHGAINLTPDKIALIGFVVIAGAVAIMNPRFFVNVLLVLIAVAIIVTALRGGLMPWQP